MQFFTDKNKNIVKTVKMEKETFLPYCLGSTGKKHLEGGENFRGSKFFIIFGRCEKSPVVF